MPEVPSHSDSAARARPRWKPSPLISGSAALHVGAVVAALVAPPLWPWSLGAVVADHLLLTAAGLWPRSRLLGPNWTRLPRAGNTRRALAITIDDGPDPQITPPVLDLLDEHGAQASFFCIGEQVRRHPEIARDIVRRGHTIENHSQRHLHSFSLLGPKGLKTEIENAQHTISEVTGQVPSFFRAPAGLRNPFLDPVLTRLDLRLASWSRRGFDTVNTNPDVVLGKLTRGLAPGDILLLHDGHAARAPNGSPVILEVLPRLLRECARAQLAAVTLRSALT